jgi:hypothetical protein
VPKSAVVCCRHLSGAPLNRILNSDSVLWAFAGDVHGRTVLDAGKE